MRILYIIDFYHPHVGGVPTFFKNLAENVSKSGHNVTVVTTHANGTKKFEKHGNIRIYRFGRSREEFMIKATMFLLRNSRKYDLIHTSTYSAMIPSYTFSKFRKIPQVLSVHEIWSLKEWKEFTKSKGPFYFIEERMLFTMPFDEYVVPSHHTKEDLVKIGVKDSSVKVIPHGIDRKVFNPDLKKVRNQVRMKYLIGKDEFIGCFVGKATVFKGVDYLLDALEKTMKKIDMRFMFILSRSHEKGYKEFMKRVYSSKVLRKNIIMVEPSKDHKFISQMIAASDFMVMPSLTEGFGFAAAEAASIGIPVIATKGTSLTEVLEENKNALFVKPRNVSQLYHAMMALGASSGMRRRLSKGKKFKTWKEVSREYVKVYESVIRKHKKSAMR